MDYVLHLLILIGIYIILSVSLNLIAGYTGLVSLAHAAFYGIGAYALALMAFKLHTPFLANVATAFIAGGALGVVVGVPSLRIRDDRFVIATLALQVIAFSILNNWVTFTGGPLGLPGIPQPAIVGFKVDSHPAFLVVVACFCALILGIARIIVRSPFGRVLKSIREDEIFSKTAGKNVAAYKVIIFVIGGGLAAVAGSLYASYISYIDPTSFSITESILILSMIIIGGAGSLTGSVLGAVVLVALPELLRFVGLPVSVAANLRQILYGGLLVIFMICRPQGLLGEYSFGRDSSQ
ncbi:MAG: branched-chain amino acid ABC transporter permease [Desulfomonilaceae bacterium]